MGMEPWRCNTPPLAHKELEMFLIAYKLVWALVAQATAPQGVPVD